MSLYKTVNGAQTRRADVTARNAGLTSAGIARTPSVTPDSKPEGPRVVMDLLGHSQIGLTMNTYSHVIRDLRRDAAQHMEDLLQENSK